MTTRSTLAAALAGAAAVLALIAVPSGPAEASLGGTVDPGYTPVQAPYNHSGVPGHCGTPACTGAPASNSPDMAVFFP